MATSFDDAFSLKLDTILEDFLSVIVPLLTASLQDVNIITVIKTIDKITIPFFIFIWFKILPSQFKMLFELSLSNLLFFVSVFF
jgi:hypothetical protein